jgi:hypothetical protein
MTTLIRLVFRVVIGLLWIRFVLKLFHVVGSGIIATLYHWTDILSKLFQGVFANVDFTVLGHAFTIESTILFAIVIYALVEFILVKIFHASHDDSY